MPLNVPTALIALRYPLPLAEIRLEGPDLKAARLWISTLDPTDLHDDGTLHELQPLSGSNQTFPIPLDLATRSTSQIRFSADLSPTNRKLSITLTPASP